MTIAVALYLQSHITIMSTTNCTRISYKSYSPSKLWLHSSSSRVLQRHPSNWSPGVILTSHDGCPIRHSLVHIKLSIAWLMPTMMTDWTLEQQFSNGKSTGESACQPIESMGILADDIPDRTSWCWSLTCKTIIECRSFPRILWRKARRFDQGLFASPTE